MECPNCAGPSHRVLQTRQETSESTIRHRICRSCGHEFYTVEVDLPPGSVKNRHDGLGRVDGFKRITFS
jgi:transcriptional regulator NrdR family protein